MEIIGAVVALLIGYFAFRGFRLIKDRIFLFLHFSFTLLGVGLLINGLATRLFTIRPSRWALALSNFGYEVFFITELIAYGTLIFAYLLQNRDMALSNNYIAPIFIIQYGYIPELIIFFLVTYITCQCAVNYSIRRNTNSFLVFIGFALIATSHVLFPLFKHSGIFFLAAHVIQFVGFISLLAMLLRVSHDK